MCMGFPGGAGSRELTWQCRRCRRCGFNPLGQENPMNEVMATHSSILAYRIPWTEEPGGQQSMGSYRGHDWSDLACTHACMYVYVHKWIKCWFLKTLKKPWNLFFSIIGYLWKKYFQEISEHINKAVVNRDSSIAWFGEITKIRNNNILLLLLL